MRSGPLRHKWFALFTATVTSGSIGDEIMRLALPLLVLDLTHDIGAAAILRVIETIPYVLFGAFAGALIDRSEKRRLLSITTVLTVIGTALRPFEGLSHADSTLALHTAVTSHSIWFHQPFRADEWLLVAQDSPVVACGRAYGRGDVFDAGGELVASFAQESLVRPIA